MIDEGPVLLHEIFQATARRHPERVAIDIPPAGEQAERVQVTYRQLQRHVDRIVGALAPFVRPDAIVAILLSRDSAALYAAQLGVLKAGGAFCCLDPRFPDEHLSAVLDNAGAVALITDAAGRARLLAMGVPTPPMIDSAACESQGGVFVNGDTRPRHLAYVVYTSGTTGKPKGVLIEHRSIVNLVTSDVAYFGLTCDDRVAQCSSPAYDSSVEETWLAFAVGATLVPLDDDTVRLGPELVPWLRRERLTVLAPPPTLLRTMDCADPQRALPDLRLVYVGGEALPPDVADRWSAGRWMENGYGPTECTVTVVRGRVHPGEPVTIGQPVSGNRAWVLDDSLQEVDDGKPGELCISGAGLARGYHRRDDLTAEKFPEHPRWGRIYRTGDLVRRFPNGCFEYLGRTDTQVKLRGYRIELESIDARCRAHPGVREAACRLQEAGGERAIAAHIVPRTSADPPSVESLRDFLRQSLPEYMVPSRFAFLDALPTTTSGKLDRNALPVIGFVDRGQRPMVGPRNRQEFTVAQAFADALGLNADISIHDDFFQDLGGNSLSAVGVVCRLKASAHGSSATVRDLYETRTVAGLAERLAGRRADSATKAQPPRSTRPRGRPLWSTVVQSLWLVLELVLVSAPSCVLVFGLVPFLLRSLGGAVFVVLAPFLVLFAMLLYTACSIALAVLIKRLLIGCYKPGRVPVWGWFFTRHWIVVSAARWIPLWFLEGTALLPIVLRALGAKIGRRVHVHRGVDLLRGGWDLLTIGDNVTLSQEAAVRLVEPDDGELCVGPIRIGDGATVDVRAGLSPGSAIESNGYLSALSWLAPGACVGAGQRWDGVPAEPVDSAPPVPQLTGGSEFSPAFHSFLMLLIRCARMLAAWSPLVALALVASLTVPDVEDRVLRWLEDPVVSDLDFCLGVGLICLSLPLRLALQAATMRAMGRVRPGVWSQWSLEGIRIWIKTGLVDSAGKWLSGAILWPSWLRWAGMRIGRCCEISTIIDVVPETVCIGDESFFADGIYFCSPWRHRGTVTIAESTLGRNTFLGNHALVPIGHRWPDGFFVGLSTVADPMRARHDSAWFGHPPMELPRRQVVTIDRRLTHEPDLVRYATRLIWELLRFAIPVLPILVAFAWYWLMDAAANHVPRFVLAVCVAPLVTLGAAAVLCGAIVVLKWMLLGRVRPGQHPFWSCWCGRWDFLYVAWNHWARGLLVQLEGTLLLNAFLRLTGVRIGRRAVLDYGAAQVVDPDMLAFEDDATVACHFQAHTFEDRILKIGPIRLGRGATVGNNAVVFYGAQIGDGAWVAPHSVVMKQDVLEAGRRFAGCPTRPIAD